MKYCPLGIVMVSPASSAGNHRALACAPHLDYARCDSLLKNKNDDSNFRHDAWKNYKAQINNLLTNRK